MSPEEASLFQALISAGSGLLGAVIGGVSAYLITKKQVRSSVLSGSREKWITELRHSLAEFASLSTLLGRDLGYRNIDRSRFRENRERLLYLADLIDLQLNQSDPTHSALRDNVRTVVGLIDKGAERMESIPISTEQWQVSQSARKVIAAEGEKVKAGK